MMFILQNSKRAATEIETLLPLSASISTKTERLQCYQ
jgi:hypothetical protein